MYRNPFWKADEAGSLTHPRPPCEVWLKPLSYYSRRQTSVMRLVSHVARSCATYDAPLSDNKSGQ